MARSPVPADSVGGPDPTWLLLVTGDPRIAGHLTGLAAAAGVRLEQARELPTGWSRRPEPALLLIGADVLIGAGRQEADVPLPGRCGAVVVCTDEPGPQVWRRSIECGAEQVVVLPAGEPWLLDRILDAAAPAGVAPVLGVIGGRGGAGASTLAVGLAAVAARSGVHTLLLDADPLGGGLDLLVGAERERGLRWHDLTGARGRLQPGALSEMLPTADGVAVLSWGRWGAGSGPESGGGEGPGGLWSGSDRRPLPWGDPSWGEVPLSDLDGPVTADGPGDRCAAPAGLGAGPGAGSGAGSGPDPGWAAVGPPVLEVDAVTAVLRSAVREFDLVVVDLSRRFGSAELAVLRACRTVILLVPAEVRATAAATQVSALLDLVVADQRLVVRGPAPSGLPAVAVADALGLALVGELRSEPAVAAALDRGESVPDRPSGALTVLSRRLLAEVLAA